MKFKMLHACYDDKNEKFQNVKVETDRLRKVGLLMYNSGWSGFRLYNTTNKLMMYCTGIISKVYLHQTKGL